MRIARLFSAAAALLFTACSNDAPGTPAPTPVQLAHAISIVSGNAQEANAGERLRQPLVVRVTDASGRGLRGVPVVFEVAGDGGLNGKDAPGPARVSSLTGVNGEAQVVLEPYDAGLVVVSARVDGTPLQPVVFTANATSVTVEFRSPRSFGDYAAFYGPCRCSRTVNTISVPVGTPLEWTSVDASTYRVAAMSVPAGGVAFDSGTLSGASRFRFVPTVAGTWQYRDMISGLTATLTAR